MATLGSADIVQIRGGVELESGSLAGKVLVVTGAGGAIGSQIALAAARAGASVLVNDVGCALDGNGRDAGPASEVVKAIRAEGGRATANQDSVAEAEGAARIIEQALDEFGQIDCVVNNAGNVRNSIFHKMTPNDWEAVLRVHLHGAFNISRAAATEFRKRASGSLIHMTSTSGLVGNVGQANYVAAKMGIVGLSKAIALDMRRFDVRSNCISPLAASRMSALTADDPTPDSVRAAQIGSIEPTTIAPLALYLASDASREVTGQVFVVRANELFVMSQPRPLRSIHRSEGWTEQTISQHAIPALRSSFTPLEVSQDVFSWAPI